jgi:hypothetical protein
MADSRYDELHDRFFSTQSSKEGTRYERLAAVVLKSLSEQSVVIHDFRLRGDRGLRSAVLAISGCTDNRRTIPIDP